MVDRSVVNEMLESLRFDEAERLISEDDDDPQPELWHELTRRRGDAENNARAVYERIVELGDQGQQDAIFELAEEPSTLRLLALLPDASRKRAELYLRDAKRWETKRRETNVRRLAEARRALDGLDLELARGLVNRIDGRFLSEEQEQERDQLILDISARALEAESLDTTGRRLIEEYELPRRRRVRPWWNRWLN